MGRENAPRRQFTVAKDDDGRRVDRVVRKLLPGLPLSAVYRLIRTGAIRLDDRKISQRSRVRLNQTLSVPADVAGAADTPGSSERGAAPTNPANAAGANAARLDAARANAARPNAARAHHAEQTGFARLIIAETDHYLALAKPKGALVHGQGGLDEAVRRYTEGRIETSLSFKPGPLHRLDRNTSGVLLFSKSLLGAQILGSLLADARKHYLAVVDGAMKAPEEWTDPLTRSRSTRKSGVSRAGKTAHTTAEPLLVSGVCGSGGRGSGGRRRGQTVYTLVRFTLHTGRTHQIRAHAAAHGHPLSGDRKYGGSELAGGYVLHAWDIVFVSRDDDSSHKVLEHPCVAAPAPQSALASLFEESEITAALNRFRSCTERRPFTTL